MLSANYNSAVHKAQRNLAQATNNVNKALERMSTGFKITSAQDDAAGLYVATNLKIQIQGLIQAQSNTLNGISYLGTAEGSLAKMNDLLIRIRDLSTQAANGTYDYASRKAMQLEADELIKELYRIKDGTSFNGKNIFGEPETGAGGFSESITQLTEAEAIAQGYTVIKTAEQLDNIRNNLSGKYILMGDINLSEYDNWDPIGNSYGDNFQGTFDGNGFVVKNLTTKAEGSDTSLGLFGSTDNATIKNLGLENLDIQYLGTDSNISGGIAGAASNTSITNCFVKGSIISTSNFTPTNYNAIGLIVGLGDSSINNSFSDGSLTSNGAISGGLVGLGYGAEINNSYSTARLTATTATTIGGLVGEYDASTLTNSYFAGTISAVAGSEAGGILGGAWRVITSSGCFWNKDLSGADKAYGKGTQPPETVIKGLSSKEMSNPQNYINAGWDATKWDLSGGVPKFIWQIEKPNDLRLQVGAFSDDTSAITTDTAFYIGAFSVNFATAKSSAASLYYIDELMNKINSKIADFGATQNRLDSVLQNQTTTIENLTSAESTIMDADIAEESAAYVKNQILQQSTAALLAQSQSTQSSILRQLIG